MHPFDTGYPQVYTRFRSMFPTKKAIESLEDRCRELEHGRDDLERSHKGLRLEWEELYDKVTHQMSRISRRVKADAKLTPENQEEPAGDSSGNSLDPISERIHRRRGGNAAQPRITGRHE